MCICVSTNDVRGRYLTVIDINKTQLLGSYNVVFIMVNMEDN